MENIKLDTNGNVIECGESQEYCDDECPYRQGDCTHYYSNVLGIAGILSLIVIFISLFFSKLLKGE